MTPKRGEHVWYCEEGYTNGPYRFGRSIGGGLAEVLDALGHVYTGEEARMLTAGARREYLAAQRNDPARVS